MLRAFLQKLTATGRSNQSARPWRFQPEVESLEARDIPSVGFRRPVVHGHHSRGFTISQARASVFSDLGLYGAYQSLVDQGYQRLGVIDPYTGSYSYNLYDNSGAYAGYWDWLNW